MKKLILSLSLLSIIPAQAIDISVTVNTILNHEATKKVAIIAPVLWYFLIWKKRKAIAVESEWEFQNLITKIGTEGYFDKEWLGNSERKKEIKTTIVIDEKTKKSTYDKETITKAYGFFGTFEASILNKLKDLADFVKGIKESVAFFTNPISILK